ncbi:hypothetical protein CQW23_35748 [Capsicum baccatum]|uniref:Uncharacterized protein n=1 Tax=Capsicum baccatum TaxID=33114 RepID=A0A2G2UUX8_CAPBA|nr:hypothetical protein CQW23_35748 [Capsicum baccatum]
MRSELRHRILSPAERLLRQLYNNQQESDFEDIVVDDKTVTLIYASKKYIPPNKIGLEAMLLVSPTTTAECSVSPSQKVDDNASLSMNVLVEKPLVSPTTTTKFSVSVSNGRRLCLFLNECSIERPLVSPTTTLQLSTSLSSVEEDNAYFSMNVPVDKPLISLTTITERSITPSPVAGRR